MPEDPEHEEMPFACLICRKPFDPLPVVTLCGHYFHSACAIKRFAKTGKCFACGKGTNGVFNKYVLPLPFRADDLPKGKEIDRAYGGTRTSSRSSRGGGTQSRNEPRGRYRD